MKQIINKEDKAVSPIIATILLIAITVVLAATLYTVLGGFTKGLSTSGSATISGTFANTSNSVNYSYSFSISSSSSGGISISSLELRLTNANGTYTSSALANGASSTYFGKLGGPNTKNDTYLVSISGLSGGNVVAGTTITITAVNTYYRNAISQISIIDTTSNSVIYTS